MSRWQEEKRKVLEAARRMLADGLVVGASGNVSLRLPSPERDLMAITPHQRFYDEMTSEDVVVVDFEVEPVEGELPPSVESLLHIEIYRRRPDANAVIHCHSPFASTLAVAGLAIPPILEDQVVYLGGEIKLAPYAPSGSEELGLNALDALGERNAALLANHGAVTVGRNLKEAIIACHYLEKAARIYLGALSLGKVVPLSDEDVAICQAMFRLRQQQPNSP